MGGTIVLGTLDLSSLCGCGSDCATCCTVTTPCCGTPINQTLYATVHTAAPVCSSSVIPVIWNSITSRWEGDGNLVCNGPCDTTIHLYLRLECMFVGSFLLSLSCDNFTNTSTAVSTSVTCSPTDIQFTPSLPAAGCSACSLAALAVDITQ